MRRCRYLALCACLMLAGCASGTTSDDGQRHGLYGGVSTGMEW